MHVSRHHLDASLLRAVSREKLMIRLQVQHAGSFSRIHGGTFVQMPSDTITVAASKKEKNGESRISYGTRISAAYPFFVAVRPRPTTVSWFLWFYSERNVTRYETKRTVLREGTSPARTIFPDRFLSRIRHSRFHTCCALISVQGQNSCTVFLRVESLPLAEQRFVKRPRVVPIIMFAPEKVKIRWYNDMCMACGRDHCFRCTRKLLVQGARKLW